MRFLTLVSAALLAALTSLAIPAQAAEKVTIAAAADLKFAMDEIVGAFRKAHPGAELDVIYGSSGKIHTQIQQGAPFDLFFSADVGFARELRSAGQAVTDPKLYAIGRIVCPDRQLDGSALHSFRPLNRRITPNGRREQERRWIEQAELGYSRFVAGCNPRGPRPRTGAAKEERQ